MSIKCQFILMKRSIRANSCIWLSHWQSMLRERMAATALPYILLQRIKKVLKNEKVTYFDRRPGT